MSNTQNLLSIVNLKKYFPVKKSSLFSKNKQALKANEDITFSVKSGETFGLVGESGCGKSTLGRTVLQLYKPTEGEVLYYGKTLEEVLPSYLFQILRKAVKYCDDYQQYGEKASSFSTGVKILGGLVSLSQKNCRAGADILLGYYRLLRLGETEKAERAFLEWTRFSSAQDKRFFDLEQKKVKGIDLTLLTGREMRKMRKDLQIVFQDPYSSLNPRMTVGQIIEESALTRGLYKKGSTQMRAYVLSVMNECGLQEEALHRYPHQFSGGQRQRICIARALAVNPRFIVCDECVSALDASIQSQILNLLTRLKEKSGLTYLFISHDLSVVRYIADRLAVMYLGDIMETGEAEKVFSAPLHPYTITLLSAVPSVKKKKEEEILLEGHMPSPISPPQGCKFHTRCFMAREICKSKKPPLLEAEKGRCVACHFAHLPLKEKKQLAKQWEKEQNSTL